MTSSPLPPHTLHAFDADLDRIRTLVKDCGIFAVRQVNDAVAAMMRRDLAAAGAIEMLDEQVDVLQATTELEAINTIARRSPQADDLRELISAIKIVGDLERVGDYAKNIAKRTAVIAETATIEPAVIIPTIAQLVTSMVDDAIKAYIERDVDLAMAVIQRDRSVDDFYNSLFRSLLVYMIESPQQTTQAAHLLFVTKNLERVGDHATNIAELVYYNVTGSPIGRRGDMGSAHEPVAAPKG